MKQVIIGIATALVCGLLGAAFDGWNRLAAVEAQQTRYDKSQDALRAEMHELSAELQQTRLLLERVSVRLDESLKAPGKRGKK